MMANRLRRTNTGFTLIEVLVALAIVGVALPALLFRVQTILDSASYIDEKNYAYWVAQNQLATLLLEKELTKTIPKGTQSDQVEFAGLSWYWHLEVTTTEMPGEEGPVGNIHRLTVDVGREQDESIVSVFGFIDEPKK